MMFLWPFTEGVLKQKERNNRCAEARYWRRTQHTQTHTKKSYDRLNAQCTKQLQQTVVVARSSTWSAAQHCSPTVNTTNTNSKKQSPTFSVYPLRYAIWRVEMLLRTWNIRFQHVYSGQCAILSTLYNGYRSILSTVHGYCAKLPTHDWHWAIPSTEYLMDIAQYCPQNIQCFWQCTIKISCICLTQYIANNLNIKCRRSITPCNNIPSPTVQ